MEKRPPESPSVAPPPVEYRCTWKALESSHVVGRGAGFSSYHPVDTADIAQNVPDHSYPWTHLDTCAMSPECVLLYVCVIVVQPCVCDRCCLSCGHLSVRHDNRGIICPQPVGDNNENPTVTWKDDSEEGLYTQHHWVITLKILPAPRRTTYVCCDPARRPTTYGDRPRDLHRGPGGRDPPR